VPNISKINSELGWSPKKSLEETINDVIVWCKLA
jgi:nucleoside-diphosphate-sugar epimerase